MAAILFSVRAMEDLKRVAQEAEAAIRGAGSKQALEEVRRTYLGRKGIVTRLFEDLPKVTAAERPAAGRRLNDLRTRLETRLEERLREVSVSERATRFDVQ